MIAAIYARKSTDQSGVSDEQSPWRARSNTPGLRRREGLDGRRRARLRRRRDLRRRVREPARVPAADERAEAAGAVPGARHVGGIPARTRSHRDGLRAEAAHAGRRPRVLLPRGPRAHARLPTDKIMLSLTAFADELEREKARQRTYDAMHAEGARPATSPAAACSATTTSRFSAQTGQRSHVERRINEAEAAVVRRIFELSRRRRRADAHHEELNAEGGRRRGRSKAAGGLGAVVGARSAAPAALPRRDRLEPDAEARHLGPASTSGRAQRRNGLRVPAPASAIVLRRTVANGAVPVQRADGATYASGDRSHRPRGTCSPASRGARLRRRLRLSQPGPRQAAGALLRLYVALEARRRSAATACWPHGRDRRGSARHDPGRHPAAHRRRAATDAGARGAAAASAATAAK